MTFHPDERHYTDGAAQMVLAGDYLTPRTPEGYLRFNKPVLTYWLLVPWYHALGISPLAGRLSFLLLSGLIVLMTHRMALLVTGNRRTSMLAAAILATHAPLLSVAVNSIPEVPLTLCWLVCGFGLLGVVVLGKREPLYYWAAYGGAGLGVAVKGMPILILVVYALLFACFNPWRRTPLRELVHVLSMATGLLLGIAWYVAMFGLHGSEAVRLFMSDQVTERVGLSLVMFLKNFGFVVIGYALAFFPWTLPLLVPKKNSIREGETSPEWHMATAFIVGWAIVMGLFIALVERFAVRYLLAVTPFLSILLADRLAAIQPATLERWWRVSGYALAATIGLAAMLMCVIRLQLVEQAAVSLLGCLTAALGVWLCLKRSQWLAEPSVRLTLAALTLLPVAYLALAPIALPDSGDAMARQLQRGDWLSDREFAYVGNPALASKTRVVLKGDMRLLAIDDREDLAIADYQRVLVRSDDSASLLERDYVVVDQIEAGLGKIRPAEAWQACLQGELSAYLAQHRQRFLLLERRPATTVLVARKNGGAQSSQ